MPREINIDWLNSAHRVLIQNGLIQSHFLEMIIFAKALSSKVSLKNSPTPFLKVVVPR